jgi:hypothetical protein
MNHGHAARFCYKPLGSLVIAFHTGNGHGDVGFLPSIRCATLARRLRRLGADAARCLEEHALSFPRNLYDHSHLLPNFHCSVILVLDLPPGAKRTTTGGQERQNIKAA